MNINTLARPNIKILTPYSSARDEFSGQAEVYIDANENPFDKSGLNRYPDPLAKKVKEKLSLIKHVPPEQTFLGNGSDEAIDVLVRIFCEPAKDNIIILPPTYGMYQISADINNVAVKKVNLDYHFQPKVDEILAAADAHSKILFICTPNNPTGNDIKPERIKALLDHFKGIVAIDEAYIDFSLSKSWTTLLKEYPRLVVLQTFSKAWGLAGIRLGMAFANNEIITLMNKVKAPYNVNQLTQNAALAALDKEDLMQEQKKTILKQRAILEKGLSEWPAVYNIYPSDTNFLLIKVSDAYSIYNFLLSRGIVVRNRTNITLCEGCLRITVGTPKENEFLLQTIKEYPLSIF